MQKWFLRRSYLFYCCLLISSKQSLVGSGINKIFSPRELSLIGYFLFFGPSLGITLEMVIQKYPSRSGPKYSDQSFCQQQPCLTCLKSSFFSILMLSSSVSTLPRSTFSVNYSLWEQLISFWSLWMCTTILPNSERSIQGPVVWSHSQSCMNEFTAPCPVLICSSRGFPLKPLCLFKGCVFLWLG